MKQNIATTPEQSKILLACGLDPKSADFIWMDDNPPRLTLRKEIIEDSNPYILAFGWSLPVLLTMLPTTINTEETTYYLDFAPYEDKGWGIGYFSTEGIRKIKGLTQPSDPIEACVKAIEWLTANKYKLNEIKQ